MVEESGKTVTEIAELFNANRDRVLYRVRKLSDQLTYKKDHVIYVKKDGIKELERYFTVQVSDKKTDTKELEKKNSQIEELQSIIKQTQKLLDQQQQLHLQANQRIEYLEKQFLLEEPKKQKEYDTPEEQEEKLRLIDEKNRYKDEFEQMKHAWEKAESDNIAVIEQNTELREMLEEAENQPKKWYQFWKRG